MSVLRQQEERESLRFDNRKYQPHQFIKNMCLEFLQILFSQREEGDYKWDANNNNTEIMIIDKYTYNLTEVESRPALIVNRGPIGWTKSSGLGSMLRKDTRSGKTTYTDLIQGSVTVNAISSNGIEAENLAYDVFTCFKFFKTPLKKHGFFTIEPTQMGVETLVLVDSKPDLIMVPVSIAMTVQEKWFIEATTAARLEKILLDQINVIPE